MYAIRSYYASARLLFELRLLGQSGYFPHLLHCAACFGKLPGPQTQFSAERGGSLCPDCAGGDAGATLSLLSLGSISRILNGPSYNFV